MAPVATVQKHHPEQWQRHVEEHFVAQGPGDVGNQPAGLRVLIDIRAVEDQPGQYLARDFKGAVLECPALDVEHADNHQQHQWQIQRIQAENPGHSEGQPIVLTAFFKQAAPEQKGRDHEEQGHAGQTDLGVEPGRGHFKGPGMQKHPGNGGVVNKYTKGQIAAQTINTAVAALS